ncbi:MAG: Tol-Pal system beta propeller repeat protein TolB [Geminicoccus sp.]|nr:Tol-Pal system beta propeller repeat protein TolB [Geminicoccus sp.]
MRSVFLIAVIGLCFSGVASAQFRVGVTGGEKGSIPVAVLELYAEQSGSSQHARDLTKIMRQNLSKSGAFEVVDPTAYPQQAADFLENPDWRVWRESPAQALVVGSVSVNESDIEVKYFLYQPRSKQRREAQRARLPLNQWRGLAHFISDRIHLKFAGMDGHFGSQILFIAEDGSATQRVKRLAMMDQDGHNIRYLSDGRNIVVTPRFSPDGREITYTEISNGRVQVILKHLVTGQQEVLETAQGTSTFSPRFSPDGRGIVYSLALNGNTDIYYMDLQTRGRERVTRAPSAETSPSISPDGRLVAFESDRSGSQQIYVLNRQTGQVRRISVQDRARYATPVWSPNGDWIAFTRIKDGEFSIGVMRPDGTTEQILATGYVVESPTWSPNGSALAFARQERQTGDGSVKTRIYAVDVFSRQEWMLPTTSEASDPAWSPRVARN